MKWMLAFYVIAAIGYRFAIFAFTLAEIDSLKLNLAVIAYVTLMVWGPCFLLMHENK